MSNQIGNKRQRLPTIDVMPYRTGSFGYYPRVECEPVQATGIYTLGYSNCRGAAYREDCTCRGTHNLLESPRCHFFLF